MAYEAEMQTASVRQHFRMPIIKLGGIVYASKNQAAANLRSCDLPRNKGLATLWSKSNAFPLFREWIAKEARLNVKMKAHLSPRSELNSADRK